MALSCFFREQEPKLVLRVTRLWRKDTQSPELK
jgi:hypothetical protein